MRRAYDVAQVRAAEAALMARLPDGALMQRAAAGLARCASTAGGRRTAAGRAAGRQRRQRRRRALRRCPAGPSRGPGDGDPVSERIHGGGLAALRRAGGRVVCPAMDPAPSRHPRGRSRGRRDPRDRRTRGAHRSRGRPGRGGGGRRSSPRRGRPAERRRRRHRRGRGLGVRRRRDRHLRRLQAAACSPGRAATTRAVVEVIDIGLAETLPAAARAGPRPRRRRASAAPARAGQRQVRPRRRRAGGRLAGYPGAGVLAAEAAVHAGAGMVRARRVGRGGRRWPRGRRWCRPTAGCRPGWSARGWSRTPHTATAVRWALDDDVPVVLDADALTVVAADEGVRAAIRSGPRPPC